MIKMKNIELSMMLTKIGQNLHTVRNARKETLQSVATDIGITHPIISKIENGRYPNLQLKLLIKLCNHYKITLYEAFSLEDANIFQLNKQNQDGGRRFVEWGVSSGFDLYIEQLVNENKFLKEQSQQLLDKIIVAK